MVAFKNRYLLLEVFLNPNRKQGKKDAAAINKFDVSKAVRESLRLNFGEHGLAASVGAFQVKYFNPITKLCIIRCSRKEYQKVWCAITLVTSVGSCSAFFNLLDLNGSIRACRKIALEYDKEKFEQYKLVEGNNLPEDIFQRFHTYFEKLQTLEG